MTDKEELCVRCGTLTDDVDGLFICPKCFFFDKDIGLMNQEDTELNIKKHHENLVKFFREKPLHLNLIKGGNWSE